MNNHENTRIILYMRPANGRRRYIVTSSLIGWAHIQNDPWRITQKQNKTDIVSIYSGLVVDMCVIELGVTPVN